MSDIETFQERATGHPVVPGTNNPAGSPNRSTEIIPGDPFGKQKQDSYHDSPAPPYVAWFHIRADTDSSAGAIHHTLGIKPTQASPGHHQHDGKNSKRLMEGITISGSRGGNVALAGLLTALATSLGLKDNTTP